MIQLLSQKITNNQVTEENILDPENNADPENLLEQNIFIDESKDMNTTLKDIMEGEKDEKTFDFPQDEEFISKHLNSKDVPINDKEAVANFIKKCFENTENNFFCEFLKNKGKVEFSSKEACVPWFYDLLNNRKEKEINVNDLDKKNIVLPTGVKISRREVYAGRLLISKQFKNSTDKNEIFLDKFFEYLYGKENYNVEEKKKLSPTKYELFYCPCGEQLIFEKDNNVDNKCKNCNKQFKRENRIELYSIEDQINVLLSRKEVYEALVKNLEEIKKELKEPFTEYTEITDITNAVVYRELVEKNLHNLGENENDLVLTFSIFVDDVPIFQKSEKGKLNGIYACINELPVNIRFNKKNLIFLGFYQVREKPHNSNFAPLVTLLQHAFYNGFNCPIVERKIRILPLIFIMDKATQSSWFNIMSFNAYCGCMHCLAIGRHHKSVGHYFTLDGDDVRSSWRTKQAHLDAIKILKRIQKESKKETNFLVLKIILTFWKFQYLIFTDVLSQK